MDGQGAVRCSIPNPGPKTMTLPHQHLSLDEIAEPGVALGKAHRKDGEMSRPDSYGIIQHLVPPNPSPRDVELSIVVPALNEEVTVGEFVEWCKDGLKRA